MFEHSISAKPGPFRDCSMSDGRKPTVIDPPVRILSEVPVRNLGGLLEGSINWVISRGESRIAPDGFWL